MIFWRAGIVRGVTLEQRLDIVAPQPQFKMVVGLQFKRRLEATLKFFGNIKL
jgi:hypothetical protein